MRFVRPVLLSATLLALLLTPAREGLACSVPVFRYALERWPPDPFGAIVFYGGALRSEEEQNVRRLEDSPANLEVVRVNLDASPEPHLRAIWEEQDSPPLPWLYVTYPTSHPVAIELASGHLDQTLVTQVLESDLRRDLAAQLVNGETAVWILLESGDAFRDTRAWDLLNAELASLEETLTLPEIEQADIEAGLISVPENSLRIAFSTRRLSRDDPDDEMLLRMLLDMEDDLLDTREPMAFPIFGRGRVLNPLVGSGISRATIAQACQYLVGACSCQVKAENPGMDLLLAMDWDAAVQKRYQIDKPIPELAGLMPAETTEGSVPEPGVSPANLGLEPAPSQTAEPAHERDARTRDDSGLILRITLPTLAFMFVVVGIGSSFIIRKKA